MSSELSLCVFVLMWEIVIVIVIVSNSGLFLFLLLQKQNGGGPKFRPPKSSPKASQDEIEIEIAEVLYGMMRQPQGQGPSKQEIIANNHESSSVKFDSREQTNNKSSSDGKSRIPSPPQNSSSSAATPMSAVGGFSSTINISSKNWMKFCGFSNSVSGFV